MDLAEGSPSYDADAWGLPSEMEGRSDSQPPSPSPTDLRLLNEVLAQRPGAFERFFDAHRRLMIACISRTASGAGVPLQDADMADVLGEVTYALLARDLHRLRMYRPERGCSVSSWVGVVATSVTKDVLRKRRRRRMDLQPVDEVEQHLPPVAGPDVSFEDRQRRAFVDAALRRLTERDQVFVQLYFVEALSPEQIAERLEVSVATVYSKKAKIKRRLVALARRWDPPAA